MGRVETERGVGPNTGQALHGTSVPEVVSKGRRAVRQAGNNLGGLRVLHQEHRPVSRRELLQQNLLELASNAQHQADPHGVVQAQLPQSCLELIEPVLEHHARLGLFGLNGDVELPCHGSAQDPVQKPHHEQEGNPFEQDEETNQKGGEALA